MSDAQLPTPVMTSIWQRRLLIAIFCGVVAWALLQWLFAGLTYGGLTYGKSVSPDRNNLLDWVVFYSAGKLVAEGHGDQIYNPDALVPLEREALGHERDGGAVDGGGGMAFFNPPFVALAFAPLSGLTTEQAGAVVAVVSIALTLAAAAGLLAFLNLRDLLHKAFAVALFAAFTPVSVVFLQGASPSMLLFLGWLGFVYFQTRGNQRASGLSLTLVLFKPQMALLTIAYLLYQRRWRALKSFAAVAMLLGLVSLAVAGPGALVDYPRMAIESTRWSNQSITTSNMDGWNGFIALLLGHDNPWHLALTAGLSLVTLALAGWTAKDRVDPRQPAFLQVCSALLLASLLINPHLYRHDLPSVALALAFSLKPVIDGRLPRLRWLLLAVAVWLAYAVAPFLPEPIDTETPAMALLFVANLWQIRELRRRAEALETAETVLAVAV